MMISSSLALNCLFLLFEFCIKNHIECVVGIVSLHTHAIELQLWFFQSCTQTSIYYSHCVTDPIICFIHVQIIFINVVMSICSCFKYLHLLLLQIPIAIVLWSSFFAIGIFFFLNVLLSPLPLQIVLLMISIPILFFD